jgi:CRISPR-associated protein Csb2
LLLDGPVLPLVTDTVHVAEAFRRAIMSQYQRHRHRRKYGHAKKPYQELFRSEVFSGKDLDGFTLRQHRHAFYLPTAEGSDPRRITHVTVCIAGIPAVDREEGSDLRRITRVTASAARFGPDELAALYALRALKLDDEDPELRVQVIGLGDRKEIRAPLLGESSVWVSATPFVVTRHLKRRGRKRDPREFFEAADGRMQFVKQNLREELERRGLLQEGMEIDQLEHRYDLRPLQFRLCRTKPGDDGASRPRGLFRLRFPSPVVGPIALGHSCHFGLGLFVAAPKACR